MANELNRAAMLGVGLLAKAQQKIEDLIEGYTGEEAEKADAVEETAEATSLKERIDGLVALGEEKYDEVVGRIKSERESLTERIRETAGDFFSTLGLVTRETLEEMEAKVSKLERLAKKAVSN